MLSIFCISVFFKMHIFCLSVFLKIHKHGSFFLNCPSRTSRSRFRRALLRSRCSPSWIRSSVSFKCSSKVAPLAWVILVKVVTNHALSRLDSLSVCNGTAPSTLLLKPPSSYFSKLFLEPTSGEADVHLPRTDPLGQLDVIRVLRSVVQCSQIIDKWWQSLTKVDKLKTNVSK